MGGTDAVFQSLNEKTGARLLNTLTSAWHQDSRSVLSNQPTSATDVDVWSRVKAYWQTGVGVHVTSSLFIVAVLTAVAFPLFKLVIYIWQNGYLIIHYLYSKTLTLQDLFIAWVGHIHLIPNRLTVIDGIFFHWSSGLICI